MVLSSGWRGSIVPGSGGKRASAGIIGEDLSPAATVTNTTGLPTVPMGRFTGVGRFAPQEPGATNQGVPGRAIARASGNPDVAAVNPRAIGGQSAPPWGSGEAGAYPQSVGGPNQGNKVNVVSIPGAAGLINGWRGGASPGTPNDKLMAMDRHAILKVGYENSGRSSGETDPPMDGPPRPSLWMVQRTINWQEGNPLATQDQYPGENRPYSKAASLPPGTAQPGGSWTRRYRMFETGPQFIGEQGTPWSPVYGGVPGLWQPYGSYAGITNGPVQGIQSPVPEGAPGDGRQSVAGGPPHGLHSQTYPDYSSTLGRYLAIPQMALPRQDRPANSPIAGQSYNQTVIPQGQTGTVGQQVNTNAGIQSTRLNTRGWRGQQPGGRQV
jgi:hypothetical protein